MLAYLARYEWLLMGLIVIGFGVAELVSLNRSTKRAQSQAPAVSPANPSDAPPPPGA